MTEHKIEEYKKRLEKLAKESRAKAQNGEIGFHESTLLLGGALAFDIALQELDKIFKNEGE